MDYVLNEILEKPFYSLNQNEKSFLLSEYEGQTGNKLCSTCTGSFITAFNELKKMAKNNTPEKPKSKYGFKPGFETSQIQVSGLSIVITADNLTDELVEEHLLNHPLIELINAKA